LTTIQIVCEQFRALRINLESMMLACQKIHPVQDCGGKAMVMMKQIAPTDSSAQDPVEKLTDCPSGPAGEDRVVDTNRVEQCTSGGTAESQGNPDHELNGYPAPALTLSQPLQAH